jgi:hypothetical protein
MTIEAKIKTIGSYQKIVVVCLEKGFSQILIDGKFVNRTIEPEIFETEILTIEKCFEFVEDAEKFMKQKFFKSLFNNIQKNWK